MKKIFVLLLFVNLTVALSFSQVYDKGFIRELALKVDTGRYYLSKDIVLQNGENRFYFNFQKPDDVCELNLYPAHKDSIRKLQLLNSADYVLLDSMVLVNDEYFRVKIRFIDLIKSQFLNFSFSAEMVGTGKTSIQEIKLQPCTKTTLSFSPTSDDLFIGEEKVFELITNNLRNIRLTNEWSTGKDINYRVLEENGKLMVHLIPNVPDYRDVKIKLQTIVPSLSSEKKVVYDLPEVVQNFRVKTSRLVFLNLDRQEVTFDEKTRLDGIEIQMDNSRQLVIGKTYRIENQEQPGGALIAELFTKSSLTNDKVLCIFRPFNFHRKTQGYLYIKEGDAARFVTNCDITPKTTITSVMVMHDGEDWTPNLNVYPGETVNVKIEGEGLHKARFHWEDVLDITSDTIIRSETSCSFKLKIPMNINKKRISLYNNVTNTGTALNVREYQVARKMDYVNINFGSGSRQLATLPPTVIQRSTIKDITLNFDYNKIDSDDKLFGKQYFDIDVRLIGKRGELIEMKTVKNVLVCPGDNSPRSVYYKDKSANSSPISLNSMIGNKTYNLEDFSKVQMTFKNQDDKYGGNGYEKQVEIVLQRPVIFDIDVSFPAGLMIQNLGKTKSEKEAMETYKNDLKDYNTAYAAYVEKIQNEWDPNTGEQPAFTQTKPTEPEKATFTDNLGGISLALIAQFSFPDAEKVGKLQPYRLGAGFLAINTFNFNENAKRDLAAVVLASLYPIKPGKIFNMPIHLGFGYKFQDKIPFLMLSPGIGVRF
jgi:hypothetical protein